MAPAKQTSIAQGAAGVFRTSAAGVQLGKLLFDPDAQGSISPALITQLLRTAGLQIPTSVRVTADVAQIVLAGGSVASAIEDAEAIEAFVCPVSSAIQGVFDLLGAIGGLDTQNAAVRLIKLGTEIAMVAASGGLNVLADIGLILDVISAFFPPDERPQVTSQLDQMNNQILTDWWKARVTPESAAASKAFTDYQNGKIGMFSMLGDVAMQAPDLFLNYFPDFNTFIPPVNASVSVTSSEQANYGGFFGIGRQTETVVRTQTFDWKTIARLSKTQLETVFLQKYILDPFMPYYQIANIKASDLRVYGYPPNAQIPLHNAPVPRIHVADLAVLSMFPPYFTYIHDNFDIRKNLASLRLTPSDLGYSVIKDQMLSGDFGRKVISPPGLTLNGVEILPTSVQKKNATINAGNLAAQKAIDADARGDIRTMLSISQANGVTREWGTMPYIRGDFEDSMPAVYKAKEKTDVTGYRNIRNLWAAIAMAEKFYEDSFISQETRTKLAFLPKVSDMEDRHRDLQVKSVSRLLNIKAKANIASFYGTTADKIVLAPLKQGQLAKVLKINK